MILVERHDPARHAIVGGWEIHDNDFGVGFVRLSRVEWPRDRSSGSADQIRVRASIEVDDVVTASLEVGPMFVADVYWRVQR